MRKYARAITKSSPLLAIAACLLALIIVLLWYPSELFIAPMQNFDTPSHLYAVEKLLNNGASEIFHLAANGGFYPPLFHIVATLFVPIFGLFGGVSVAWIIGAGIIFPLGMYFLVKEILINVKARYKHFVLLFVPTLSVSFLAFPYSLLDIGTLYAYGFAVALLPWFIMFTKRFWRSIADKISKKSLMLTIFGVIASMVLVILAQPRVLFLAIPIVLVDGIYFVVKQWKTNKKVAVTALLSGCGALAVFVVGIVYYVIKSLRSDLLWHPEKWFEGVVATHSWGEAILAWFSASPNLFGAYFVSIIVIITTIVSLIFAIKKWKNEISQKFLILYSLFGIIYVFCVSSVSGFAKIISAPWYQNGWRILAVLPILIVPIFALAVIRLCEKMAQHNKIWPVFVVPTVIVACSASMLFGSASLKMKEQIINQTAFGAGVLFDESELGVSRELDLESDSLILADPTTGANYISFFTSYDVVFPIINPDTARQEDLKNIIDAFSEADSGKLATEACAYSRPVYFTQFGGQSNVFGGEHILLPWYGFHNQATIDSFVDKGVFQFVAGDGEYSFYKIICE